MNPKKLLVLLLALPLLAGCTVYEEHVTLDAKGGAAVDIQINNQALAQAAPEAVDTAMVKAVLARSRPPDVEVSVDKKDGSLHVVFEAKNANDLLAWARKENNPLGTATIQTLDGTMDVTRTFAPLHELDLKELDRVPDMLMVFKLTGPGNLVSSDATRTEGSTAIWEVHPRDIFSGKGKTFNARYKISTPWMTYSLIAMMILGVSALLYFMLKKRA